MNKTYANFLNLLPKKCLPYKRGDYVEYYGNDDRLYESNITSISKMFLYHKTENGTSRIGSKKEWAVLIGFYYFPLYSIVRKTKKPKE
jgi:hypothetical protein